ncbi:hypothetical protein [Haloferula helveola]|uniref:hypothetical protein n=1 Tax=Haloferula helveola TaxID=490095 RepID=UPI0030CBBA16
MNLHRRQFLVLLGAAACLTATTAHAAPKKKKKNQKKPLTKPGHAAELPTVQWVRGNRFKVGKKTYVLSDFADVIVNGEEAKISDLKPGMQAMVTGSLKEAGDTSADSLYKATRVVARRDNNLEKKAQEEARKLREQLKKQNQRNNKSNKSK